MSWLVALKTLGRLAGAMIAICEVDETWGEIEGWSFVEMGATVVVEERKKFALVWSCKARSCSRF